MNVQRLILKYDKRDGHLLERIELVGIDLAELRLLFGETPDEPMYYSYVIGAAHKERLEHAVGITLDLASYDYFVDAESLT